MDPANSASLEANAAIWSRCQDVLDYYSKIMQFRGIQNPPGRFQVESTVIASWTRKLARMKPRT